MKGGLALNSEVTPTDAPVLRGSRQPGRGNRASNVALTTVTATGRCAAKENDFKGRPGRSKLCPKAATRMFGTHGG